MDAGTLHVRCGSDIRGTLVEAGFGGEFLELSDPLVMGPVPDTGDLLAIRARFVARAFGLDEAEVLARERAAHARLMEAKASDHPIVLWFEHDSYDQLILARTLAALAPRSNVALICIDRHPRPARFIGLGQLLPEDLRALYPERRLVGAAEYALAAKVWEALRAPTPEPLAVLRDWAALPFMGGAVRRHLQELPWAGDGLSLSERLALGAIAEGAATAGRVFGAAQARDPLPYLGDLMQWSMVRDLAHAAQPALWIGAGERWPERPVGLTELGAALLAGQADWLAHAPPERWVGGVRVGPEWRWVEAGGNEAGGGISGRRSPV